MTTVERHTVDNVFEALMETPAEAANMTMRSDLLRAIRKTVQGWGLPQTAAAKRLGVSQPGLNDLLKNRINKFSLDALVTLGSRAGLTVRLDVIAPEPAA
ncbi:MAG TPA: helix-turn-helix transcriptional regulator [Caulobacteraceae bacterium]|nr:helix-turn-helix transcriptional regulator [Caulobacteraceae bacterium]